MTTIYIIAAIWAILALLMIIAAWTVNRSYDNKYVPECCRWVSAFVIASITFIARKWKK